MGSRTWRIDRVMLAGTGTVRTVAALIDIEQEERTAEARATAEMIHILGHELLNGLAPIVSLAESGEAALASRARSRTRMAARCCSCRESPRRSG